MVFYQRRYSLFRPSTGVKVSRKRRYKRVARFTELKENVDEADSEFEDLDYNKVDKALKSIGINLKDTNGQFRDLDDVFLELAQRWSSLSRNQ